MNQPAAKAQEPSMEEILASIRRIIADDDTGKPQKPEPAPPKPAAAGEPAAQPAVAEPAAMIHDDIDTMLSSFDQPPPASATPPHADPQREPEVLDLTEAMATPEPEPPGFRAPEPDVMSEPPPPEPEPDSPSRRHASQTLQAPSAEGPIVSAATSAAVDAAFNALAHTVLVQNARTLEDLVKEMLRPMLKTWLDDNLPTMVERLVRAEIERVSRGR
jgi:cell pole-organizing protein PopZ